MRRDENKEVPLERYDSMGTVDFLEFIYCRVRSARSLDLTSGLKQDGCFGAK